MQLEIDSNTADFLKASQPGLEREASVHSFLLSLAGRLVASGKNAKVSVRGMSGKKLLAAGLQTDPGRALILSKTEPETARAFARALASRLESLPAINGPTPAVDCFAEEWAALKNRKTKLATNLRLFDLKEVFPPPAPNGFARLAETKDREIIFRWLRAFHEEAVPHDPKLSDKAVYEDLDHSLANQMYFVWEDAGECVCLVGSKRETATERWIAPVYTPPQLRGQGYASALVAYVSERILASGKRGMLFTDLENPTSNSIYQKVGYRPVADFKHIEFV